MQTLIKEIAAVSPLLFGLCFFHLFLLLVIKCLFKQDQAEGIRMDVMWRPPLPEITAGKADTDCPSQGDYCEVRFMLAKSILRELRSVVINVFGEGKLCWDLEV